MVCFCFRCFVVDSITCCWANTLVSCITLKRRLTGEPFDAEAAAAVIERIFLTALGSFRMWRGMDHWCGALGVNVYCMVHSTVAWSLHLDVDPVAFIAVVSDWPGHLWATRATRGTALRRCIAREE